MSYHDPHLDPDWLAATHFGGGTLTTPFDPDEDVADDDDAPDTNPDPAPPQDGDPSAFEPDLGGEG